MTVYTLIKFLHVLLAIMALGFNASYGTGYRAPRGRRSISFIP
jgi:hypothetical protein